MSAPTPLHHHPESPPPFVIGTAGHVDHGKSTLVRALTGIDPDRLAEEREREMTIDLGFAWLALPDGRSVSVIDVPGHERFVRNMLAGVGGIDLALLVIAADDGPMPQTREHLAILDLLGIDRGVVAITRADLVEDEWRDLVVEEARELVQGTTLAGSPIVAVSSVTGEGLDDLRTTLATELDRTQDRDASGRPRLPIDRAFHVAGFGTVVTGTLLGGHLRMGQELMMYPERRPVRVRGIQVHQQQSDRATPGSRVAVNLSGIDRDQVRRGNVLAEAGALTPSLRLDCRLRLLEDAPVPLEQNQEVIVFAGADEVPARVTLLDSESIAPGEAGWVQLRLAHPLAVLRNDRIILRRPSPAATIGGGQIVDAAPPRHKRFQPALLTTLEVLAQGTPQDVVRQTLSNLAREVGAVHDETGLPELDTVLTGMIASGELVALGESPGTPLARRSVIMQASAVRVLADTADHILKSYHLERPLEPGMKRDEFRSALRVGSQQVFDAVAQELERQGVAVADGSMVHAPDFHIKLDSDQRGKADRFLRAARAEPHAPPSPQDYELSPPLIAALVWMGELVQVADQIAYPAEVFADIRARVLDKLDRDTSITLAEYRDLFATSRKYAQPTLEYLDRKRITRRMGDIRVRYRGAGAET